MIYLDVLIGFSLVMLVFASGVSVTQTLLKRITTIKGAAMFEPLKDAISRAYDEGGGASITALQAAISACKAALVPHGSEVGSLLRTINVADAHTILGRLKKLGGDALTDVEAKQAWNRAVDDVAKDWDRVAGRLAASYEQRTRRWVLGISLGAALAFNVDAIRILQVLSVSPETRTRLGAVAEQVHQQGPPQTLQGSMGATFGALTDWQKGNLAALAGTGLPIGWGRVSLYVFDSSNQGGARRDCLAGETCEGTLARESTVLLWLLRVLGLLVGAGLIAQGAPFWYSIFDTALGLKKRAQPLAESRLGSELESTVDEAEVRLEKVVAEAEAWSKALAASASARRPGDAAGKVGE